MCWHLYLLFAHSQSILSSYPISGLLSREQEFWGMGGVFPLLDCLWGLSNRCFSFGSYAAFSSQVLSQSFSLPAFAYNLTVGCAHGSQSAMPHGGSMLRTTSHPHPPPYRFLITQCSWWKLASFSFLQILSRKPEIGLRLEEEKEYVRENTPSLPCPCRVLASFLPSGLTFHINIPLRTWELIQMQTYDDPFPEPEEPLLPLPCNWVSWDTVWNDISQLKPFWYLLQRLVHWLARSPFAGWPAQAISFPL